MRTLHAALACAVSAALLAGCSGSQMGSSIAPSSGAQTGAPSAKFQAPHHKISFADLLKEQIAGKMAPQAPVKVLKNILEKVQARNNAPVKVHPAGSGTVAAWSTNEENGYLLGTNAGFKKLITAVDTESNGCYYPTTVKVDHDGNAWSSCEYDSSFENGQSQEYSSTGQYENSYDISCPSNIAGCEFTESYSFDQAENSTNAFVNATYFEYEICNTSSCNYYNGTGYEYWPLGSPSSQPTFVNVSGVLSNGDDVESAGYFDVDSSNIYFMYQGFNETTDTFGYGLAEVQNYATSPNIVDLIPVGTIGFWGGVNVGKNGSFVSTIDQDARTLSKYSLPWSGSPTVYGPFLTNAFNVGDPISGGWNKSDKIYAAGDGYGWIDSIKLPSTVKAIPTINCSNGCFGAAYSPSDK